MYSVTIVWSAFAFIHLRLVLPTPPPDCDSPFGAVECPATHAHTHSNPLHSHSSPLHCTLNVIYRHFKDFFSLTEDTSRGMFILIDVLSWTHMHAQTCIPPVLARAPGMKWVGGGGSLWMAAGVKKASYTVNIQYSFCITHSVGSVTKAKQDVVVMSHPQGQ